VKERERRKKGIVGEMRIAKKKRWVRRALRKWMKERGEIADYKREKELCGVKRREENERWEEEAEKAKTEKQVWRIVNRKRRKWKSVMKGLE